MNFIQVWLLTMVMLVVYDGEYQGEQLRSEDFEHRTEATALCTRPGTHVAHDTEKCRQYTKSHFMILRLRMPRQHFAAGTGLTLYISVTLPTCTPSSLASLQ